MGRGIWRRRLKVGVPVAVIAVAAAVWLWHPRPTDQEQIAALIQQAEHGVETKNVKEITSCVSPDYKDSEGLTHTDILRLALQWARVSEQAEVTVQDYQLEVTRPTARATCDVVLSLGPQGGAAEARNMQLTVRFSLERRGWRRMWLVRSVDGYDLNGIIEGL